MSKIFKASIIIGISFALNKILALFRQYLIARQFGFGADIDAFNVANNMPDLIFSLFSGGALAMAFIPVFAEYLDTKGQRESWKLFSGVTTFLFLITTVVSIVVGIAAPFLVSSQFGIAPGFDINQQKLVVNLLRINLIATLIFSISGLVTASLQAHKNFLLPAISPIFYNLGIIFGAVFLSSGMGIYGLTYGVVLGAVLHLAVQIPGLFKYNFKFSFSVDFKDAGIRKVIRLMGPRILTVLLIQITFLLRDNFASRLEVGSVTALTYGYFIMQVPETLIGTSIATALLPSLSEYINKGKIQEFARVLSATIRVLIGASLIVLVFSFTILSPLVDILFDFSKSNSQLLVWTTQAFMSGLLAHVLLEVFVRAFYARQQVVVPFVATLVRTLLFVVLGILFFKSTGAVGIATIDSITVGVEVLFLLILLWPVIFEKLTIVKTLLRSVLGGVLAVIAILIVFNYLSVSQLVQIVTAMILALVIYTAFVIKEVKMLTKL